MAVHAHRPSSGRPAVEERRWWWWWWRDRTCRSLDRRRHRSLERRRPYRNARRGQQRHRRRQRRLVPIRNSLESSPAAAARAPSRRRRRRRHGIRRHRHGAWPARVSRKGSHNRRSRPRPPPRERCSVVSWVEVRRRRQRGESASHRGHGRHRAGDGRYRPTMPGSSAAGERPTTLGRTSGSRGRWGRRRRLRRAKAASETRAEGMPAMPRNEG